MKVPPVWGADTVFCLASGPSLIPEDCDRVRDAGATALAVNTTFRLALWARALYAMDIRWWRAYHEEVRARFPGERYSYSGLARDCGAVPLVKAPWFGHFGNSGAGAIMLAAHAGAKRIVLLGYDCSIDKGFHWHGRHTEGLSNCASIKRWPAQFQSVALAAKQRGVEVLNASRDTTLTCFPRIDLESVL